MKREDGVEVVLEKGHGCGSLKGPVGVQRAEDPGEGPETCIMCWRPRGMVMQGKGPNQWCWAAQECLFWKPRRGEQRTESRSPERLRKLRPKKHS